MTEEKNKSDASGSNRVQRLGDFELKKRLGKGGMGEVFLARQISLDRMVALKTLSKELAKKGDFVARFEREAKSMAKIDHPNVVKIYAVDSFKGIHFAAIEYIDGKSVQNWLDHLGRLSIADAVYIAIVSAEALKHAHSQNMVHRDIKPDNILVNKTGEVRVIDFSLATRILTGVMKLVGGKQKVIMGTRTYIAPELILKSSPTPQSDIYSLGVTIYEMATGSPPFAGLNPSDLLAKHLSEAPAPPSAVNRNVAPELDALILKLLAKKPKDRPAEMREVMSLFRNVRCFQEDPAELFAKKTKDAKANESLSVDKRLDSRADADRVARGLEAPAKPVKGKHLTASIGVMEAVKKPGGKSAATSPPAQQQPPAMPQMPYGMPVQPMPGMMYPGMMPGQPMMPQMMQPQMMPGMQPHPLQMPGQPMMMPGQFSMPQQPVPQYQVPPTQTGVAPAAPSRPENSVPQTPAAPRTPPAPVEARPPAATAQSPEPDLDFMTELPDIL